MAFMLASGCAQGAIAPADFSALDGSLPEGGGVRVVEGGVASNGSGLAEATADTCDMGAVQECSCGDGGMGTRRCYFDPRSPTSGFFSDCMDCMLPEPPKPDTGTMSMPDAGVPGDIPTGGKSTGGSGGTGGSTGGSSSPPPPPPPPPPTTVPCPSPCVQPCFPFGILPCCRSNGTCGCTWAPGAYCT